MNWTYKRDDLVSGDYKIIPADIAVLVNKGYAGDIYSLYLKDKKIFTGKFKECKNFAEKFNK